MQTFQQIFLILFGRNKSFATICQLFGRRRLMVNPDWREPVSLLSSPPNFHSKLLLHDLLSNFQINSSQAIIEACSNAQIMPLC